MPWDFFAGVAVGVAWSVVSLACGLAAGRIFRHIAERERAELDLDFGADPRTASW